MKYPLVALAAVVGTIALSYPVHAQLTVERHEAAVLLTEPVTINSNTNNVSDRAHALRQVANSIGKVGAEKGCKTINPLDILNDPEAAIKKCEKPASNQPTQRNGEPVDYLKVPRLDSGVSLTFTNF